VIGDTLMSDGGMGVVVFAGNSKAQKPSQEKETKKGRKDREGGRGGINYQMMRSN
jgi:hypothetical protein